MEIVHHLNIGIHVIAGILALITGIAAVIVSKRSSRHRQLGRFFMYLMIVVIITGLAGVVMFNRNHFLLVITLLSGYNCFSGIRAIRRFGQPPILLDYIVPLVALSSGAYYLYYVQHAGLYWAPVIIYSTLGALFIVCAYDLSRGLMTARMRSNMVMYEHVYKMFGALSALFSAFTGTVLPQYKPYSQFLPSMVGLTATIIIFILLATRRLSFQRKTALQIN